MKIMNEIDAASAGCYLRETGRVPAGAKVAVGELAGGVSNIVLLVEPEGGTPFVIKQCRERLRVAMEWRARLDRIWFETAALELLGPILDQGTVPRILFIDKPNYLFAMTRAPEDAVTWKSQLLAGHIDLSMAARVGEILAAIHTRAQGHPLLAGLLADVTLFDELRIDPYYRTIARAHPAIQGRIDDLIAAMDRSDRTLVLGDYSPKNLLVHRLGLVVLDFECAHAGDRAFDLGFCLSHLMLKAIRAAGSPEEDGQSPRLFAAAEAFWSGYRRGDTFVAADFSSRVARHTAACVLARVDGKSPVEYLDTRGQEVARQFALRMFAHEPAGWDEMAETLRNQLSGV